VFGGAERGLDESYEIEAAGAEGVDNVLKVVASSFHIDGGATVLEGAFPVLCVLGYRVHVREEKIGAVAADAAALEGEGFEICNVTEHK
jgi:hypothetical protein